MKKWGGRKGVTVWQNCFMTIPRSIGLATRFVTADMFWASALGLFGKEEDKEECPVVINYGKRSCHDPFWHLFVYKRAEKLLSRALSPKLQKTCDCIPTSSSGTHQQSLVAITLVHSYSGRNECCHNTLFHNFVHISVLHSVARLNAFLLLIVGAPTSNFVFLLVMIPATASRWAEDTQPLYRRSFRSRQCTRLHGYLSFSPQSLSHSLRVSSNTLSSFRSCSWLVRRIWVFQWSTWFYFVQCCSRLAS